MAKSTTNLIECSRTEDEIETMINQALEDHCNPDKRDRLRGMTYQQGIRSALMWLMGEEEDPLGYD